MVLLGPDPEKILLSQTRGVGVCLVQGETPLKRWTVTVSAGVRVACARRGWDLPDAHTNSSHFLPCFRLLKNWLTESAKLIAQSGQTVEWVTPLGLPIVQPYYRSKSTVVSIWCAGLVYPSLCHGGKEGKDNQALRQQAKSLAGWHHLRVSLQSR